jgi:hypothetical protein
MRRGKRMRLLTRSDFDGLVSAVLLKEVGIMDEWQFVHPKDVQDGAVQVTKDDILVNVPFAPGCGLWFDHHSSEMERLNFHFPFEGASKLSPSCARVIWDYYGGKDGFPEHFHEMLEALDRHRLHVQLSSEFTAGSDLTRSAFVASGDGSIVAIEVLGTIGQEKPFRSLLPQILGAHVDEIHLVDLGLGGTEGQIAHIKLLHVLSSPRTGSAGRCTASSVSMPMATTSSRRSSRSRSN